MAVLQVIIKLRQVGMYTTIPIHVEVNKNFPFNYLMRELYTLGQTHADGGRFKNKRVQKQNIARVECSMQGPLAHLRELWKRRGSAQQLTLSRRTHTAYTLNLQYAAGGSGRRFELRGGLGGAVTMQFAPRPPPTFTKLRPCSWESF